MEEIKKHTRPRYSRLHGLTNLFSPHGFKERNTNVPFRWKAVPSLGPFDWTDIFGGVSKNDKTGIIYLGMATCNIFPCELNRQNTGLSLQEVIYCRGRLTSTRTEVHHGGKFHPDIFWK